MILLDSDHVTVLQHLPSQRRTNLVSRMVSAVGEVFGVPIVAVEEQMRGWLATIAKERQFDRQIKPYFELERLFRFYHAFHVVSFDAIASAKCEELRASKVRIGTMDSKIARLH